MGLDFEGDWDKFLNLGNIERAMRDHMGDALETAGELLRGNIVKGIRDNKYNFAPLAESTKRAKIKAGHDPNDILIATGDYMGSFTTKRMSWDEVRVGTNYLSDKTKGSIPRALEFGYEPRNLPARPHVGPALEESVEEILDTLGNGLATMFKALRP